MAGYNPNQPRDDWGRWTEAAYAARKAAGLPDTREIKNLTYSDYNRLTRKNPEEKKKLNEQIKAEIRKNSELQSMLADFQKAMNEGKDVIVNLDNDSDWYVRMIEKDTPFVWLTAYRKNKTTVERVVFPWEIKKVKKIY